MIKKSLRKMLNLVCLLPIASITAYSLSSCGNQEIKIERIELEAEQTYLVPGEQVQINARIFPSGKIYNDLIWTNEIILVDGPFLTNKGLFVVPQETSLSNQTSIFITAISPFDSEVSDTIEIKIGPKSIEGFDGFENNQITYVDHFSFDEKTGKYNTKTVELEQTGQCKYVTKEPVKWFAGDIAQKTDPLNGKKFDFVPKFSDPDETKTGMYFFHAIEREPGQESVEWYLYQEGTRTDEIPMAAVGNVENRFETIVVKFELYEEIELVINGIVYLGNSQVVGPCNISYDKQPGDPHSLVYHGQGDYTMYLFCPTDPSRSIYRESLSTIYISRQYWEYLADFRFEFKLNPGGDVPKIVYDDMFDFKYDIQRLVRQSDYYEYYKLSFYYTFDLSKLEQYNPAVDGYKKFFILDLQLYDDSIQASNPGRIEFRIQWV